MFLSVNCRTYIWKSETATAGMTIIIPQKKIKVLFLKSFRNETTVTQIVVWNSSQDSGSTSTSVPQTPASNPPEL